MRPLFCLIPITLVALLAGCAQSPLVDNIATSNKRLNPWLPPLPAQAPNFRADDWAIEPALLALMAQRAATAPVAAAAPAPAPAAPVSVAPPAPAAVAAASSMPSEQVSWMRQAKGCEEGHSCAEVSVDYPRFPQNPALTDAVERQLGAVLTALTQPQLIQPAASSASFSMDASVDHYLSDSYSEGFVELSSTVLRSDDHVAVLSVSGTLHRVGRDVSETQYVLFDRTQQRLVTPAELAKSPEMSRHVSALLRAGSPSDAAGRAANALLDENVVDGDS